MLHSPRDRDFASEKIWNPTKLDLHSALNMFMKYSMTEQKALEEYTGHSAPLSRRMMC